ncbi:putative methylase [Salmonella enterica subsp. enterica serovar Typhimurium str. DT104]|nr:putative methylase [Salmonella enterica subsp. enterica serovar Typhimurium str. DT104]
MSRLILGNCVDIMSGFPERAVDFILTDPPYLVGFRDRSGRSIAGDRTAGWLQPACNQMYRVLKKDALLVSFYGWNRVDRFMAAWKSAGFSVVGHLVFTKTTRQNPRMSATAMNALTCWRKAVRPCHRTRCRMSSAGSIPAIATTRRKSPLPACNR